MTLSVDLTSELESGEVHLSLPRMTDEEFFEFCQRNQDLRIERDAKGGIIIMPPAGAEGGRRSGEVFRQLGNWSEQDGTGVAFDASAGFTLPNGAVRSPDASWVKSERWEALSQEKRERFAPLCPDFAVEVMSRTDRVSEAKAKMDEYMANGAILSWLIDQKNRQVHVYRPNRPVETLTNPGQVSADPELPGFVLDLKNVF
jgi:Uma2 family endonuclease